MRIRLAIPDELDDKDRKEALDAALEAVTRTNTALVRAGKAPPAAGAIKSKRVKWHPEPPGDEHFDLPATILGRGHGDCDDLAPWHAGSLRAAGIDPDARAVVKKSGPKRWHAIVVRGDGSIEDPSAHAGMHSVSGESPGAGPAIQQPMSGEGRMCVAICPQRDPRHPLIWFARCDVPDRIEPWDWSSLAAHPDPTKALLSAVKGVQHVAGDDIDADDHARLGALNDLVLGYSEDEVGEALHALMGDQIDVEGAMEDALHSVGFFGSLLKNIGKVVSAPVKAVTHIPGVSNVIRAGLPIAASAFGPLGTAGGALLANALAHGGASRPMPVPPSAATRGAAAAAGQPRPIPAMQGIPPAWVRYMQQVAPPTFLFEGQKAVRPWGVNGPAVMRF